MQFKQVNQQSYILQMNTIQLLDAMILTLRVRTFVPDYIVASVIYLLAGE